MALSGFVTETKEPEKEDKPGSSSGTSRPSSGNSSSSDKNDDDEEQYYGDGSEEEDEPEAVFDEAKQNEVVENLKALLTEFDTVASLPWITFTEKETEIIDVIKSTINQTLNDADNGKWIYVEDYVYSTYKSDVESVRAKSEALKETGEYEAFKGKLKELPIYLLEYLAKTMFGLDVEDYL